MTEKLIESIPNISEGRDSAVVEKIVDAVRQARGCKLLEYSMDADHNRSVITYVGDKNAVKTASIEIAKRASELIDLRKHKGEHPRIGAVDVMPFVPIKNITKEDCISLSEEVGKEISEKLDIPVYLYEESARTPERKNLAEIRKGGFEGLNSKIKTAMWTPDFGRKEAHKSAGAIVVGARKPLIAFNIILDSDDLNLAKMISSEIRERDGGLKGVKALGMWLDTIGRAQVSMNLTDYTQTSMYDVFEQVKKKSKKYDIKILGTELIGLVPRNAVDEKRGEKIGMPAIDTAKIIENLI